MLETLFKITTKRTQYYIVTYNTKVNKVLLIFSIVGHNTLQKTTRNTSNLL